VAISEERLVALIGKKAAKALAEAGVQAVSDQECQAWEHVREKMEFLLSAQYMIAKKPLLQDPEKDASELRYLVEETLKMVGVVNGCTPYDDLRFQLAREEKWHKEVVDTLRNILVSFDLDPRIEVAVRSLLDVRSPKP
jgi:hypothetical protein